MQEWRSENAASGQSPSHWTFISHSVIHSQMAFSEGAKARNTPRKKTFGKNTADAKSSVFFNKPSNRKHIFFSWVCKGKRSSQDFLLPISTLRTMWWWPVWCLRLILVKRTDINIGHVTFGSEELLPPKHPKTGKLVLTYVETMWRALKKSNVGQRYRKEFIETSRILARKAESLTAACYPSAEDDIWRGSASSPVPTHWLTAIKVNHCAKIVLDIKTAHGTSLSTSTFVIFVFCQFDFLFHKCFALSQPQNCLINYNLKTEETATKHIAEGLTSWEGLLAV